MKNDIICALSRVFFRLCKSLSMITFTQFLNSGLPTPLEEITSNMVSPLIPALAPSTRASKYTVKLAPIMACSTAFICCPWRVGSKADRHQILNLKSDISLARTDIDEPDYSKQQHINSQRLRLLVEVDLPPLRTLHISNRSGLCYDGGDGDSGIGALKFK